VHPLKAGTLSVSDLSRSRALYERWLDYETVEEGRVEPALADSWGAPGAAGAGCALLRPASGADVQLRLVEAPPVGSFVPLVTYGWAALEFCVQDVLAVNERMLASPFEIIGPPRKIEGLDAIHPMQVKGPDGEVCYFTQINDDLPDFKLPRAAAFIDKLFINVLAASDMRATQRWLVRRLGFSIGRGSMEIVYTMLAKAFGLPLDQPHLISTMAHGEHVFLEVDQMPPQAGPRPCHSGLLPPGIAITTLQVPDLEAITAPFASPPARHGSCLYQGRRSATAIGPDGTLFELVETGPSP